MKSILFKNVYRHHANQFHRSFSTTAISYSVKNFARFSLVYRGTELEKKQQKEKPDRNILGWSHGVRHPGYYIGNRFVLVPESIPELIVPDLTNCEFKPYVSYRAPEPTRKEFTPRELFDYIYCDKIEEDFKNKKLDADGNPLEPSEDEKLTSKEAFDQARRTGSDLFTQDRPYPTRKQRLGLL